MENALEQAAQRTLAQLTHGQETLKTLYLQPDRAIFLAENAGLIFKIYTEGDILQHEYTVAQRVQAAGVPIPEIVFFERDHYTTFAMKYVAGIPLTSQHRRAAQEAGKYMSLFHNIRDYQPSTGDLTTWENFVVRWSSYGVDKIEKFGLFSPEEITALREIFATVNPQLIQRAAVSLIHSDLRAEHIIIDPHTQQVRAFLDFADARIGDPLLDFAVISLWDEELASALLAGYPDLEDTSTIQRMIASYRLLRHVVELPWLLDRNLNANAHRHIEAIKRAIE